MQNIGKIIEDKLREKGISVSEFARRINTNRNNAYDIFRRDSIDTQLLQKICSVLNYDFFQHFIFNTSIVSEPTISIAKKGIGNGTRVIELEKKIQYFKELLNDKNRIITLLEEKNKEV